MGPNRVHPLFRSTSQQSQASDQSQTSTNVSAPSSKTDAPKSRRKSTTTSFVWDYGDPRFDSPHGQKRWHCRYCRTSLSAATTSTAIRHLQLAHRITEQGKLPSNQTTLEAHTIKPSIEAAVLRKLIVEWIIDRRHSFKEVEAESFRKIIEYIDEATVKKIPHSGNTIRSDCLKYFKEAKLIIAELLSMARSQIHLSFDLSTSPNCKALLAITAHWTSNSYQAEATLLAIRELEEEHSGENMSEFVYDVVKEYGIVENLGYFVMDNATNNDTALKELNGRIQSDGGDGFNPIERRLRCFGHIMNLAVKDLLYGPKKKKEKGKGKGKGKGCNKDDDNDDDDETDKRTGPEKEEEEEDIPGGENEDSVAKRKEVEKKLWRALGAVGKAHNIVKYVRGKPQHRSAFLNQHIEKLKDEILQADNNTRWNSTWNMLVIFLRQRERIEAFLALVPELKDDVLTDTDWADIESIMDLLKPFKKLTILGEERGTLYGSVGSILWGFEMLLGLLENERQKSRPSDAPFQKALDASWAKLNKYYKLTDKSPVHIVATILDPRMKFKYFERMWDRQD